MKTAAFQGERGAFSEEAARQLLGDDVDALPCESFDDVFAAVNEGRATSAVVPIENSLAGSVLRNYELLAGADLTITGEAYVRIALNLIGHPGVRLEDIRRVSSHPVALAQCRRFLASHPFEVLPSYDTAGSVKNLIERGSREEAAIAGAAAAEIYGGEILASGIEDHHQNYTRFLLLEPAGRRSIESEGPFKTTLLFRTANRPGALFRALAAFALRDIDLSKIESRPIEGRPWEYSFYVDIAGAADDENVASAMAHLGEMCESVRMLGSYPAGELKIEN
jgi:prephenate dehydratase